MRMPSIFSAGFIIFSTTSGRIASFLLASFISIISLLCEFSAATIAVFPAALASISLFSESDLSRVASAFALAMDSTVSASEATRRLSTSVCSAARISAISFSRLATSFSRLVETSSAASTSLASTWRTSICERISSIRFAESFTEFSYFDDSNASSFARRARLSSWSLAFSDLLTSSSLAIRASSRRRSDKACCSAISAILEARAVSIAFC